MARFGSRVQRPRCERTTATAAVVARLEARRSRRICSCRWLIFDGSRGSPRSALSGPPDAERFEHAFCEVCGSSLPTRNTARGVAVIPMGSLDTDPGLTPQAHIFVSSKASWFEIRDALAQYDRHTDSERIA